MAKFEEKNPEIKPEKIKSEAEIKREEWWEKHGLKEGAKPEKIEAKARKAWWEKYGLKEEAKTTRTPAEEKKAREILGEIKGLEKKEEPKESFKEVQNRLLDKLEKARTRSGEKLSWGERNEMARDFYLDELGYSLKRRGLFHGKTEVLDNQGRVVAEFKTSFSTGKETPLTDFLKEKLKNKIEGKQEALKETKGPEKKEEPQESFKDVQNRLLDELERARTEKGRRFSWSDRNKMARDFYLDELGYSIRRKGLFGGKTEILDSQGRVVVDKESFKKILRAGGETPLIDFLKEKLRNKIERGL